MDKKLRKSGKNAQDFMSLVFESKAQNAQLFSLIRLQLLCGLTELRRDGATFTELKNGLGVTDGALYANLNALKEMGYITSQEVKIEGKTAEAYMITPEGVGEWQRLRAFLKKLSGYGGHQP